ncbi:hypothetical protein Tco_0459599 [Tanacetum coccineum]
MQSQRWTDINAGIQQHLQKLYDTNKASLKAAHWVINPETGTYDVEIAFWNDPRNQARAAQNCQNRASARSFMASSKELAGVPVVIDTFFVTHTVNGVFIRDEDRAIYEEMVEAAGSRLQHRVGCALHLTVEEDAMHGSKGQARGPFRCCLNDTHNSAMSKSEKEEQYESTPEFGSGSGGCGDDEIADDEDGGEDEEDEEDGDS